VGLNVSVSISGDFESREEENKRREMAILLKKSY